MQENYSEKSQRNYRIIMIVAITAFITFMITSSVLCTYFENKDDGKIKLPIQLGEKISENSDSNAVFNKVKSLIKKNYLKKNEIDENKLEESAISGYVDGLGDKYTEYIPKSEMQSFTENINGSFVGIGIYMVADEEKGIVVYYPIPNSPAEEVGIKSGDIIKKVNDIEYGYSDFNIIADKIKGEEGTNVKVTIEREEKEISFDIVRKKINTNPIMTEMLESQIGYIKIPAFDSETSKNFEEKVDELINQGAKSLIIDLRNNGGGILDASTDIADLLLPKGNRIISTKDGDEKEEVINSKKDQKYGLSLVILTNENTASASEVLTGALKDNKRAISVGTKTYGKGVIQTVISLVDGSGIKITTAEYFTPNGTRINEIGITPDYEVQLPDSVKNIYSLDRADDTQLKKAIELLK